MLAWRSILVACDFSEVSLKAVQTALELARQFQSKLLILHVIDTPLELSSAIEAGFGVTADFKQQLESNACAKLKSALEDLGETRMMSEFRVSEGSPHLEILRISQEEKSDLVVIGNQSRSASHRFWLGSVAEKVVRRACCSVLVVRTESSE